MSELGSSKISRSSVTMVKVGDRIRIIRLDDPYTPESYNGREGIVKYIDSMGQLHGTWGGLAVIPEEDEFIVL